MLLSYVNIRIFRIRKLSAQRERMLYNSYHVTRLLTSNFLTVSTQSHSTYLITAIIFK